jgi:hypothetical protein
MNAENMYPAKTTNDGVEMPLPNFILHRHFRKHKSKKTKFLAPALPESNCIRRPGQVRSLAAPQQL